MFYLVFYFIPDMKKTAEFQRFLAGDERIELPPKVLETPIIPFDQSPVFCFASARHFLSILSEGIFVKKKMIENSTEKND